MAKLLKLSTSVFFAEWTNDMRFQVGESGFFGGDLTDIFDAFMRIMEKIVVRKNYGITCQLWQFLLLS